MSLKIILAVTSPAFIAFAPEIIKQSLFRIGRINADKVQEFIKSPGWEYDTPNITEFYEFMSDELGDDGTDLPGYDYPRGQAGWRCAVQQRYAELSKEMKNG